MKNYITIGTYDGVHVGHQKILKTLVKESLKHGMENLVIYFPFPPKFFFARENSSCLITAPDEREKLLYSLGVSGVKKISFDSRLALMDADSFFEEVLMNKFNMGGMCVGQNFAFGRDRKGHVEFLKNKCTEKQIHFNAVSCVKLNNHTISSSVIRTLLRNGHVELANKMLSREYEISGKVIKGSGLGRLLGFPTANLEIDSSKILPPGVFVVQVHLGSDYYFGVANVGKRPTIETLQDRLLLEVHILDFSKMIYGKNLDVKFLKRLRGERKFESREALQKQILKDIHSAREYLSRKKEIRYKAFSKI